MEHPAQTNRAQKSLNVSLQKELTESQHWHTSRLAKINSIELYSAHEYRVADFCTYK